MGEYPGAREYLQRALVIEEREYGKDHVGLADTLRNLATAYSDLGDINKQKQLLLKINQLKNGQPASQMTFSKKL